VDVHFISFLKFLFYTFFIHRPLF